MTSTIKVDNIQKVSDGSNIIKKCGSTITIGSSGQTVAVACGATTSGMGRTGTVDWCTTAKTSPFTATSGDGFFINTTSGAVTVTLPASPSAGDIVAVQDYANTAATNNITVGRNGSKIDGTCICATIDTNGEAYTLIYVDGTEGWKTINTADKQIPTAKYIVASGGTETTSGNFKIHTFTSNGTFTVSEVGNAGGSNTVSYMVVAGGGATQGYNSSGGGAGGYREGLGVNDSYTSNPLRSPTGLPVSAQAYPITIGAGGTGGTANYPSTATTAQKGNDSIFSTITSAGGGSGSGGGVTRPSAVANGGSGGAGCGSGNTPPVSPPQGNDGGPQGGGGAGEAGGTDGSGHGGDGVSSEITGSAVTRAGGGGGAGGPGGDGGGGPSQTGLVPSFQAGTAGTANTGGGAGGGSDYSSSSGTNANGGSGIVVIRYKYQ